MNNISANIFQVADRFGKANAAYAVNTTTT